jgi:hypothetical protein
MKAVSGFVIICAGLAFAPVGAPAQGQYPLVDAAAARLVQKYQTSSCEQLAAERLAPKPPQREAAIQRVGQLLRQDPQIRMEFVSRVAAPIVDKMIVCGFIPG